MTTANKSKNARRQRRGAKYVRFASVTLPHLYYTRKAEKPAQIQADTRGRW